jgi:hypothetical protein
MTEIHTYADGTQRVGSPPFPKLSPKEEQEAKLRGEPAEPVQEPARRGRPPKTKDAD